MKPVVGVLPSIEFESNTHFVRTDNLNVLIDAGAAPIVLPYHDQEDIVDQMVDVIDGVYLTGGNDIDPTSFDEEPHPKLGQIDPIRDRYEFTLLKKALQKDKPILAICKGCQMVNIALGGDMYQDIYSQINRQLLQHSQHAPDAHASHYVDIKPHSKFAKIVGASRIKVNSRHHQANRNPGKGVFFSGMSSDGVVEVIESEHHHFVIGVQWHPENMAVSGDKHSEKLYERFIQACKTST